MRPEYQNHFIGWTASLKKPDWTREGHPNHVISGNASLKEPDWLNSPPLETWLAELPASRNLIGRQLHSETFYWPSMFFDLPPLNLPQIDRQTHFISYDPPYSRGNYRPPLQKIYFLIFQSISNLQLQYFIVILTVFYFYHYNCGFIRNILLPNFKILEIFWALVIC